MGDAPYRLSPLAAGRYLGGDRPLFHNSQESRTTDLDYVRRSYLHATSNVEMTADQTATLPRPLAAALRGLIAEHEGRASLEADCARDADQPETLLQARTYADQGHAHLEPFIESALAALRTRSGRRLAEAAMRVSPRCSPVCQAAVRLRLLGSR